MNLTAARNRLLRLLGPSRLAADATQLSLYCRDMMTGSTLEMKAGHHPHLPDLVVWPESVAEVSQIVKTANQYRVPVIPFGAGSGVSGGTLPVRGGIIVDLKRMNRLGPVVEKPGSFEVTAETGILGQHLEDRLNETGFTLGHFPSSILCATLGGYLAARSAGQFSSRYGKIEEMTLDVEAVLPQGEIVPFGGTIASHPRARPKDILVGSEGTLGIITRARLRVHPLAPASRYRGINFNRLEGALDSIREIMQSGLRPTVVRLYDPLDSLLLQYGYESRGKAVPAALKGPLGRVKQGLLHTLLHYPDTVQRLFRLLPTDCLLILGFTGEPDLIAEQERLALEICRKRIARDLGEGPGLHWLKHRYSVSYKMPELFEQDCFVDTIEVAATWDKLGHLYESMRQVLGRFCLVLAHFSHAYPEGCSIYFTILGRTGSAEKDCSTYRQLWREAMEHCLEAGGTISHHHGIGLLKAEFLPRELGNAMKWFREIKHRLDPHGIMNPGKMGL